MKALIKFTVFLLIAVFIFAACKKEKEALPVVNFPPWTLFNKVPVANAGPDQVISFPISSTTLNGSASSDPDGNTIFFSWVQISGPNQSVIAEADKVAPRISALIVGTYKFRLLVKDVSNGIDDDTVAVIVSPFPQNISFIQTQLIWVRPLSIWRIGTAAATAGNKILFAGGISVDWDGNITAVYSRVDIFDFTTNHWSTAELSEARSGITAVSAGNKILFAGGIKENGNFTTRVDIYDVVTNSWSIAELSEGRTNIAAASAANKILFAGGGDESAGIFSNRVDIYDISLNSWSTGALSEARAGIAGGSAGNKILFVGGWNNNESNRVDIYDVTTNAWSTAALNETKRITAVTTVGNTVYFAKSIGGANNNLSFYSKQLNKYAASSGTWSLDSLDQFDFLSPVYPHAFAGAGSVGDLAVFVPSGIPHFIIYNTATGSWAWSAEILPFGGETAFVSANGQIYIAGWEGVWRAQF